STASPPSSSTPSPATIPRPTRSCGASGITCAPRTTWCATSCRTRKCPSGSRVATRKSWACPPMPRARACRQRRRRRSGSRTSPSSRSTCRRCGRTPMRSWPRTIPPCSTVKVYVTGDGFETTGGAGGRGIPTTPTLAVDPTGALYLARGGRRYSAGEFDYLQRMYRIPPGGARLTPATEERYFHGPPLINAQVMGARGGRELLVSTFDRDRRVGVLYRLASGRIHLFAGGTPERGLPPALVQPEGAAVDAAGHVYVADRERGVVVRLDAGGN